MARRSTIASTVYAVAGLLVVAAIPSFIRERSRTSSAQACINNLRQIDAGVALFNLERSRLDAATQAFIKDHKSRGNSIPDTVTLHELLSGGYLSNSTDVAKFNEAVVTFSTKSNKTNAKAVWVCIRYSDDFEIKVARNGDEISDGYVSRWW